MSDRTCSVASCERPVLARSWCTTHYKKWRKYGDPLAGRTFERLSGTPEQRFWPKVNKGGPISAARPDLGSCWLWKNARNNPYEYGNFRPGGERRKVLAHRWAYEELIGPVPEGLELDHLCRTPACVRPSHLEPVTHRVNIRRGTAGQWQQAKTHCPRGHVYSPENTRVSDKGHRWCLSCAKARPR